MPDVVFLQKCVSFSPVLFKKDKSFIGLSLCDG